MSLSEDYGKDYTGMGVPVLFLGRALTFLDIMEYYSPGNNRLHQTQTPKHLPLLQSSPLVHESMVALKLLVALPAPAESSLQS